MDLSNDIAGILPTKAQRLLREHIHAVLSQYELTPMEWSMLVVLAEARNGVQHAYVAEQLHVKAPFVTALAQLLLKRDLIRSVPSQFDARGKLLALTPAGKKVRKIVQTALNRRLKQLLVGVSDQDIASYHKVLITIIGNDGPIRNQR